VKIARKTAPASFARSASQKGTTLAIKCGSKQMLVVAVTAVIRTPGMRTDSAVTIKASAHQVQPCLKLSLKTSNNLPPWFSNHSPAHSNKTFLNFRVSRKKPSLSKSFKTSSSSCKWYATRSKATSYFCQMLSKIFSQVNTRKKKITFAAIVILSQTSIEMSFKLN
jgi:hypothetical protein